jgi:hypothetical protein
MFRDVVLIYDDAKEPVHCEDLFSYQSIQHPDTLTCLEAKVDTREMTLSVLGDMFPKMQKLRLNNSIIQSIRDVGCTLVSLRFLSLARCDLSSLDGISTISPVLEELHLAFNRLTDVCDLMGMEKLRIVDLKDNHLADIGNIEILSLCPRLKSLTLSGNPATIFPDYRDTVRRLLPQLVYLDESRIDPHKCKKPKPPTLFRQPDAISRLHLGGDERMIPKLIDDQPPSGLPSTIKPADINPTPAAKPFVPRRRLGSPGRIIRPKSARRKPF